MTSLETDIADWVRDVTGTADITAVRRSAGASRQGWAIDARSHDGRVDAMWLRLDSGHGPLSGTVYTLRREATVYRALEKTAVRVPRIVAVHPDREAFLAERLEGANWFSELTDPDEQVRVATGYMRQLAELHRVDPGRLDLPGFGAGKPLPALLLETLDTWESQFRSTAIELEPLIALALRWLRRHIPTGGDVVLVHGDAGPGNFMYADGEIVAVVDWEISHLGDPHEDLAWICVRDLQERFTHLPDRFRDYEQAGGTRVDLDRLRYFRVFAQTQCAIGTKRALAEQHASGEMANHLIYSTLHLRVLAEALAGIIDTDLELQGVDDPGPTTNTPLFDVALADLQDSVVPNIGTDFGTRRAKGVARLIKHLREKDRFDAVIDEAELADLTRLLGYEPAEAGEGRRQVIALIDAGTVDDVDVLRYAARRVARLTQTVGPAMGSLANRHYAAID